MPSRSLKIWQGLSAKSLDEIESAHSAVGGSERGRRYATQQINHGYVVLLASHFQQYCRGLHSEAVEHIAAQLAPVSLKPIVLRRMIEGRKLDYGNANPGNLGSDFGRLGIKFWNNVNARDWRNPRRQQHLESLNEWRNAVAHQDFNPTKLAGRTTLHLSSIRQWRRSCDNLAKAFDATVGEYLLRLVGIHPWP
jgi:hypothetical protein